MVRIKPLQATQPIYADQLCRIPRFRSFGKYDLQTEQDARDNNSFYRNGTRLSLSAAIDLAKVRAEKEYEHSKVLVANAPQSIKATSLQDAFSYVRHGKQPQLSKLTRAVRNLQAAAVPTVEDYLKVITVYEPLQAILSERDKFLQENNIDVAQARPTLLAKTDLGQRGRRYDRKRWINFLMQGVIEVDFYLQEVKDEAARREVYNMTRSRQLRRKKLQQKKWREAGKSYQSYCIISDCEQYVLPKCSQIMCDRHCMGPCVLHEERLSSKSDKAEDVHTSPHPKSESEASDSESDSQG